MKRRGFLKRSGMAMALMGGGWVPLHALPDDEMIRLTILHTNDTHSRIEPFPEEDGRYAGLGGIARRASLIEQVREGEERVLLLDAGDIFQGTPYFTKFGGELEFKAMSAMGYDASTIGNHDFDAGIDGLVDQWPHADFPFVSANYDFSDTALAGSIPPYIILQRDPLQIGIFGLGIELEGLVPEKMYGETRYTDPLAAANTISRRLRKEEDCDYVICLSHLGYNYDSDKISDRIIARETEYIDLIIGGHTHTFMDAPEEVENAAGRSTIIHQVGWAGIILGRLDILFSRGKEAKCVDCRNELVGRRS